MLYNDVLHYFHGSLTRSIGWHGQGSLPSEERIYEKLTLFIAAVAMPLHPKTLEAEIC